MQILDLDEMIESSVQFKLHGVSRVVKPLALEEYFKLMGAFAELTNRMDSKTKYTSDELIDSYFAIFSTIIEPIARTDVEEMTTAQCAATLSMIVRRIQGESIQSLADLRQDHMVKKKHSARLNGNSRLR